MESKNFFFLTFCFFEQDFLGPYPADVNAGTPDDERLEVVAVLPEDVHYSARERLEVVPSTLVGSVYHYAREKMVGSAKGRVVRELDADTMRMVAVAYEE